MVQTVPQGRPKFVPGYRQKTKVICLQPIRKQRKIQIGKPDKTVIWVAFPNFCRKIYALCPSWIRRSIRRGAFFALERKPEKVSQHSVLRVSGWLPAKSSISFSACLWISGLSLNMEIAGIEAPLFRFTNFSTA